MTDTRTFTDAEIATLIRQSIADNLMVAESEIVPSASFVDTLGADSLDMVELSMAFEEAFDIEIPDEDAEKIVTVADAHAYIRRRVGAPADGVSVE